MSEDLPGAVPQGQNTPRRAPYGLYPEQINGTGFTLARAENLRTWMYRVRPSAGHPPFESLAHGTFTDEWVGRPPAINLEAVGPLPIPDGDVDFVDGMHTYGGAGSPELRRGYAVHCFACSRSMEHRCFVNADGEMLIVPQHGALTLMTELGPLEVPPGKVALVPRGLKFSVLVEPGGARGYVAEVFGRRFSLPERGPVGANGMADERDFFAPEAWHEDRQDPGYRVTAKLGGKLHEMRVDHTPWDVVGWHGRLVPYVYDLAAFAPLSTVLVDHADPSIYTVLSAPLDEPGSNLLDLVVFPQRWDATEHTFRPPFFHRNATTELNGIVHNSGADQGRYAGGMLFLTPAMTPHGVTDATLERALAQNDEQADAPHRETGASLWFQFESTLPLSLTAWAREGDQRIADWHVSWGAHRSRFEPDEPST